MIVEIPQLIKLYISYMQVLFLCINKFKIRFIDKAFN